MTKFGLLLLAGTSVFYGFPALSESGESEYQTLLEIGAGVSVVDIPHYAGSEQSKSYTVPFPFFKYESKDLLVNRDGLKRHLIKGDNWDLDLSFSGTIPVDSDDNRARQNMPDLDWVGLAGPAFNYKIYKDNNHSVKLKVPIRLGVATDFNHFDSVGWDFSPKVQWRYKLFNNGTEWNTIVSLGLQYGSSDFNDYYYSVASQYQTETRPEYIAESGYGGYKITFGVNRREGKLWVGAFTRYRNLSDAAFINSPLVTTDENFYFGLAAAWIFSSNRF